MKKISSALIVIMLTVLCANFSFAATSIVEKPSAKMIVSGKAVALSDKPILVGGKLYLKIKALAVNIGIKNDTKSIIINNAKKQYTLVQGKNKLVLKLNNKKATFNGKAVTLALAPMLYKNNVYLPVEAVAGLFGKKALWDETTGSVVIYTDASFKLVKDTLSKANKAMDSVKYKTTTSMNTSIGDVYKSTVKSSGESDSPSNIEHSAATTNQNGVIVNEEEYTTKEFIYTKSSQNGIWIKTASDDESAVGDVLGIESGRINFVYSGLAVNTNGSDIIVEGDIEMATLFDGTNSDAAYKAHTKITIQKSTYYIKEIKWNCSGTTPISGSNYKYALNALLAFSDFNGSFELKVPEELTQLPEMVRYENSDLSVSMYYPATWTMQEDVAGLNAAFISAREDASDQYSENVSFAVQDLSESPITLEQYTQLSMEQFSKIYNDYDLVSSEEALLAGQKAQKVVYTIKQGEFNLKIMQIWTVIDNNAYVLTYCSEVAKYDSYIKSAEDIVKSFIFE